MDVGFERNEELWPKAIFTRTPGAGATAQRMADKDVHPSKCPLEFSRFGEDVGEGAALRGFSLSRLIDGIAIKTSGGKRFAEAKQHFL